jgi:hypothetical protein
VLGLLLRSLLYFPSRAVTRPHGLDPEDLFLATDDGERLHAWWVAASGSPRGHILFCHGNAGNIASRGAYARILSAAGFDVLLFDYRGYGRSSGRPTETGTYRDARAALARLRDRSGVRPERTLYLGESLGAAVALELALEAPPAGVILQSAFTSVRDMAREVLPLVPRTVVPDAYPSLRLIPRLASPLLVLHGEHDDIVPVAHGRALFAAARSPKRLEVLARAGHNDLLTLAADEWIAAILAWSATVLDGGAESADRSNPAR